ncbi:MAG: DUF2231 domain-containing protein [Anaerolineae bacterium]
MESRAKALGHPIHPMLIVFPLGLLSMSVIVDIIYLITGNTRFPFVSFVMIIAGVIGGIIAAFFGLWDFMAIPRNTRAKSIGLFHGGGNVVVMLLFLGSWLLRYSSVDYVPSPGAVAMSVLGFALAGVTGWLGGELVDRLGVGVDRGANLNAPNSLGGGPADATEARAGDVRSTAK